jgi:hypothetical protein
MRIGDTVKFGRVRFKVIMLNNQPEGEQIYKESKFNSKLRKEPANQMSNYKNTLSEEEEEEDDVGEGEFEEEERMIANGEPDL